MYEKSIKAFKRILKENKNMTAQEWDKYAHENQVYSSTTLMAHIEVSTFEKLKRRFRWF